MSTYIDLGLVNHMNKVLNVKSFIVSALRVQLLVRANPFEASIEQIEPVSVSDFMTSTLTCISFPKILTAEVQT